MRLAFVFFASRRNSRCARRLRRGGRSAGSRCSLRVSLPHAAMRAARGGSGGAAVRPGRVAPFGFHCLTPLCALRAVAPAGRPVGRVALLPSGFFASRRYARCARRLRRGGRSAGSHCSLMSGPVLLRHASDHFRLRRNHTACPLPRPAAHAIVVLGGRAGEWDGFS